MSSEAKGCSGDLEMQPPVPSLAKAKAGPALQQTDLADVARRVDPGILNQLGPGD